MFDNICSINLRADIFAQAIHPTAPILAVGLSSGRVETYRLPPLDSSASPSPQKSSSSINKSSTNKPSALSSKLSGRRHSLENGYGVVETLWTTKRHQGSCRTLCLSGDGAVLYSAGTDGIVKAADMETGRVVGKIAVPLDG
jgi:WD40 repeat protein